MITNNNANNAPPPAQKVITDDRAMNMLREGFANAWKREKSKKAALTEKYPPEKREALFNEAFPVIDSGSSNKHDNINENDDDSDDSVVSSPPMTQVSDLTPSEIEALRKEVREEERRKMKATMRKVQEQISEYHALLEFSKEMEDKLKAFKERAKALKRECDEKEIKLTYLEREVIDLKLNLAMEKSGADEKALMVARLSNELKSVKSENANLVRTISSMSMQSLPVACMASGGLTPTAHLGMPKAVSSASFHVNGGPIRPQKQKRTSSMERCTLQRPSAGKKNAQVGPMSVSPLEDNAVNSNSNSSLLNRTVSWMNSQGWIGQNPTMGSEHGVEPISNDHFYPSKSRGMTNTKSTATITTVGTNNTMGFGSIQSSIGVASTTYMDDQMDVEHSPTRGQRTNTYYEICCWSNREFRF